MLSLPFGNKTREYVLQYLTLYSRGYAREMAMAFGIALPSVQNQLNTLADDGILKVKSVGKTKFFSFNDTYPLLDELKALLKKAFLLYPDELRAKFVKDEMRPSVRTRRLKPLYSQMTTRVKLKKALFDIDLLWSIQDASDISVAKLLHVYLARPNQKDVNTLVELFGSERVNATLERMRTHLNISDFNEAADQVAYAIDPNRYSKVVTLEQFFAKPTQRDADQLLKHYGPDEIAAAALNHRLPFPRRFEIEKMIGIRE